MPTSTPMDTATRKTLRKRTSKKVLFQDDDDDSFIPENKKHAHDDDLAGLDNIPWASELEPADKKALVSMFNSEFF